MQANIAHQVEAMDLPFRKDDVVRITNVDEFDLHGRHARDDNVTGPDPEDIGTCARVEEVYLEKVPEDAGPALLLLRCVTLGTFPRTLILADFEVEKV